jgi:hypothetical protein
MVTAVGTPTMGVNVKCGYTGAGGVVILATAVVDGGNAIGGQWWRLEVLGPL